MKEFLYVFVGTNYYCEYGIHEVSVLYSGNPLWDGGQCLPGNSCCDREGQPWFFHQLTISETQHLEVCICQGELSPLESVTVKELQLFVQ